MGNEAMGIGSRTQSIKLQRQFVGNQRGSVRRICVGRKTTAYLTVEAALVLPMVMGFVMLTIYLLFFQYNRCMFEQDIGALTLRGDGAWVEDKNGLLEEMQNQAAQIDYEKYIAWQLGKISIRLEGNYTYVEGDGNVLFPFEGFMMGEDDSAWRIKVTFRNQRVEPVAFVRNWRKWMGGK